MLFGNRKIKINGQASYTWNLEKISLDDSHAHLSYIIVIDVINENTIHLKKLVFVRQSLHDGGGKYNQFTLEQLMIHLQEKFQIY